MSVRSLSDRVTLQQDTPKLTSPVHKGRDKTAKSHTSTSSLLEKLPNQEIADKGRTASLSNVIIQTETDNLGETDKCENVEQATFNQQLTLTSQKAGVQISNSSEEKMLNETASLQPVQKDMKIVPSKGSHIMPQHSIQRLKVSSERSRSSSLPIINEAIGQTIRSRTATLDPLECHSRGKYLAKKATDIIHPEIDSKQTSTEKPFGYLQKCREEIKLEDKTKKTTLNWIEKKNLHTSGEYMKPAREELKDSLSVPATTDILGQKPESSQVICPTTKPQTLLFKDEMKTGVSQRSLVSKIPKTLQKANSETSQDLTKNKNAQVSVGNKTLQPPQVNTSSLSSPKKGKLPISSRKGSIKHSLRKDIVHRSPKMEMQGMPRSKGNLHNSQCEPNQSIKPGQSQNSPDKKCSPCSPKKRLPHLSPNKAASKHFPTDGIRITQNKPDSKIPIHIHSPTEAASQKSSKEFLQNVSQGTSSLLSKKGPSPHRGIPVPSTRISHQSHNNISTNRSTPETLSNPAPTLNKDVQHELPQNNASQDSEDKSIYHGQVKNILEESPTRLIKQYSKENVTVFLSSDVDKLQLTVDSEVGATQQDSGGRDTGKVTSTVPTEDLINQNIESESFHLNVSQILTDEGLSQELKDSNKPFLLSQSIQPKPSVY